MFHILTFRGVLSQLSSIRLCCNTYLALFWAPSTPVRISACLAESAQTFTIGTKLQEAKYNLN